MTTLEGTLHSPAQRDSVDAIDRESQSFTLVQSLTRMLLTVAVIVGMSALFGIQVYATLR